MPSKPTGPHQTLLVAVIVAVVAGTLVSAVSVWLAPRQAENDARERQAALQSLLACDPAIATILAAAAREGEAGVEARVVDLDAGCYVPGIDATCFDVEGAAAEPGQRLALTDEQDIAGIGERPNRMVVYEVRRDGDLALLVLPVYGIGYQSRIAGYLGLGSGLDSISALVFNEHGETPGMGARISEPEWQATWRGKRTHDENGVLRIGVATRSGVPPSPYEVDAMSGATRTGQGVTNLLRFWLGELGYGPLIQSLRSDAPCVTLVD